MSSIVFNHSWAGELIIGTGIDDASWGYNLNMANYPTYGGEVVQILSVYIDDLMLQGTVSTYAQMENIYSYFAEYFIAATQGSSQHPKPGESYNLDPMTFHYAERNWSFRIYPKAAPGFRYMTGMTGPQWRLQAHVIDDSPDLNLLKEGIKGMVIPNSGIGGVMGDKSVIRQQGTFSITGNISPKSGNPETDPFQTFNQGVEVAQSDISKWSDYYSGLIPAYMKGDFSQLTGVVGSQPNFGRKHAPKQTLKPPKTPKTKTKHARKG